MANCKYKINLNGKVIEFGSDEELDSFIDNNYYRLKAQSLGVKFSKEFDPKEEAIAKLKKAIADSQDIVNSYDSDGIKQPIVGKGYTGVTRKIDQVRVVSGQRITKEFNVDNYIKNNIDKYAAVIKQDPRFQALAQPAVDKIAEDQIKQQLGNWKMLGVMGTDIHAMMQAYFEEGITSPQEMIDKIKKPFELDTMKKYIGILDEIKNRIIRDTGDSNPTILSEVKIHDPNSKVAGILDLVAIDKEGNAYIYDLKSSYKKLNDWDASKTNKMYYQMAFYRQLLGVTGVNTKGISIVPLELIDVDYNNNLVSDLKLEANQNIDLVLSTRPYISQTAREVIPSSINSLLNVNVESAKIKSQLQDAFGYEVKNAHVYGVDTFMRTGVKLRDDGNKSYFFDYIKKKEVDLTGDPVKDKATIEEYLTEQAIAKNSRVMSIKNALSTKILDQSIDLFSTMDKSKNSFKVTNYAKKMFEPYLDGCWELIKSADLDALGTLGFNNKYTGALEFVAITANDLNAKIPLAKGSTILGNHLPDEVLRQDKQIYTATAANMEALKLGMFLNDNIDLFKGSAGNHTLGFIKVVNLDFCQAEGINLDDLVYNYGKLSKYTGVTNELNSIKRASAIDTLMSKMRLIVESDTTPHELRSRIDNMMDVLAPDEDSNIIDRLKEIQTTLVREYGLNVDEIYHYNTPLEQIYALVSKSILDYQGIVVRAEENTKNWSLSNSTQLSDINNIASKNIQHENVLVKNAMNNIGIKHVEFKQGIRGLYKKLFDDLGISKTSRFIVGDYIGAYSNMMIRTKDGKVANQMRVKDPSNMSNDLKPAERIFLKEYLKTLNDIRYKGKGTEDIAEAKSNGDWFDIPLLKASSVSRFKNGDSETMWKNYYDNVLNYYKLFKEDQAEAKRISNDMLDMFNPFNSSVNNREKILATHTAADFETDLELVLDSFKMANTRKEEFDKVLPTIHALRNVTKWTHVGLLDKNLSNTLDFMKDYTKTAVYNEKLIEPNMEGFSRGMAVLRDLTSKLALTINPIGGIREFLQGQYGNMSRIFAKSYGKDMFTRAEYSKAIGFMINDAPDFINNVTAIEELNHIYRISDMDINSIVERLRIAKSGFYAFSSRWQFWFNAGPEYFNRMSLFVAQMIHDGSFDAHKMVGDAMIYDWKKDKRFDNFANGKKTAENYNEQKGFYTAMMNDFISQGLTNSEGQLYQIGDALPYAYTSKQKESLKSFSDSINGSYDHETKVLAASTTFGMMFIQFRTWLLAKKDQWALKGDIYVQGNYEHVTDENGNKLYHGIDEDGCKAITTVPNENPVYDWKGKWQEGIAISLGRVFSEIEWGKMNFSKAWDLIKTDDTITSNLKMMSHDLAIVIGLAVLFGLVNWKDLKKDSPGSAAFLNTILGSGSDLFVGNNIAGLINPKSVIPAFGQLGQMGSNFYGVLTGDINVGRAVANNIGFLRPIAQDLDFSK